MHCSHVIFGKNKCKMKYNIKTVNQFNVSGAIVFDIYNVVLIIILHAISVNTTTIIINTIVKCMYARASDSYIFIRIYIMIIILCIQVRSAH